jgi:hypothetical protein
MNCVFDLFLNPITRYEIPIIGYELTLSYIGENIT